jgi:hypothetical protein
MKSPATMDERLAREILSAVREADEAGAPLDEGALRTAIGLGAASVRLACEALTNLGLAWIPPAGEGRAPVLRPTGRQYLDVPSVDPGVIGFLTDLVDDLPARAALLRTGREMLEAFASALANGSGTDHAAAILPTPAHPVDEHASLNLFASCAALLHGLDAALAPASAAEQILAVRLIEQALEAVRTGDGLPEQREASVRALQEFASSYLSDAAFALLVTGDSAAFNVQGDELFVSYPRGGIAARGGL